MAKRYFHSEESYDDFMHKSGGTGHGENSKGVFEVEYEKSYKENED